MRRKDEVVGVTLICVSIMVLVAGGFPVNADTDGNSIAPFSKCVDRVNCDEDIEECPKQDCYYGECKEDGKCDCIDKCWGGADCKERVCENPEETVIHHRSKRATVAIPAKMEFTLTKTPDTLTELMHGQRIDFTLKIRVPVGDGQQLLVELFAPNNATTIMMLYDVRITNVGSEIKDKSTIEQTKIFMDSKPNEPWPYDRAVFDFASTVSCCNTAVAGDSVNAVDIEIEIQFSAAMYSTNAVITEDYWVSAGAEYANQEEIWIGQASFKYKAGTATAVSTPVFEIVKPAANKVKIGIPFELKLKMKINDPVNDPLSVDVIAPLQTTSIVSACGILISKDQGNYKNFKCLVQVPFQSTAFKDADGIASGRARLELGRVINAGVSEAGASPDITSDDNMIELSIYMMFVNGPRGEAVANAAQKIGMAVELGTERIWAGESTLTPLAGPASFANTAAPNVTLKPVEGGPFGPGSIVNFDLVFTVPATVTADSPSEYQVEALMPVNAVDSKPQLGICRMEIIYHGWNVPCVVPPQEPEFTKTIANGMNDRGVWNLGPLVNMQGAMNETNTTANEVHVRIYASVAKDVPTGTLLSATIGLYVGDKRLWVAMSENITTAAAQTPNTQAAVGDAPVFGLNYTFDSGNIPLNAVTDIQLDIKTKRGKEYGMLDLEIMMPNNAGVPMIEMCRAEVIFGGRNLPCFDKEVANASMDYRDRSGIRDRALLTIGQTCNVGSYNIDVEDKIIVRALIKVISPSSSPTAFSAGVMYSTTTIWVASTSLTVGGDSDARLNSTHPNKIGLYVDPEDGTNDTEVGLCKRFIVKLKLPPQSRSLYTLKVSTTSDGIVCAMNLLSAGTNYDCEGFLTDDTRLQDAVLSEDKKSASLSLGVVTNPYIDPAVPGNITDNSTLEIEFFITTKLGAKVYTVDLEYQPASGVAKKTVNLDVTGTALKAYSTPANMKPDITIVNAKWASDDPLPNNNVIKGQPVRLIYEANIKSDSRNKMKITVSTTITDLIDFTNIGVLFAGKNLPCIIPQEPPYDLTSAGGKTNDTIAIDIGVVKLLAINTTNITESLLRVEVVGRVRLDTTFAGSTIPIKFRTEFDSDSDEKLLNLNLQAGDTYTDVDSTANVTLTFDGVANPFYVKPGSYYSVKITATIPMRSSTKATLDCEAPYIEATKHAKAVVTDLRLLSAGSNLVGMQADTYEPIFSSKNGIQNSRAVLDLGVVSNSAFGTRIHNDTKEEDSRLVAECTYHVADEKSMAEADTYVMSTGLKVGSYIVITDLTNTVQRTNSEKPKYSVNATILHPAGAKFTKGQEVEAEVRFAHTWDSTAEGLDAQLLVFMPPFMEYVLTAGATTNTSGRLPDELPTLASPPENYLKFKWTKYLFPENTTIKFKLRLKTDIYLPSGLESDRVAAPIDSGSKMETRASNAPSTGFLPSEAMSFIEFDVHGIPVPSASGGATCTEKVLGMENGDIKDCQLSSSEESLNDRTLVRPGTSGWSPFVRGGSLKQGRYLQAYLGPQKHAVYKVQLIAKSLCKIQQIRPRYSTDGGGWIWGEKVDVTWTGDSVDVRIDSPPLKYIQIYLYEDNCALGEPVMLQMELKGCNTETPPLPFECTPSTHYDAEVKSEDVSLRSMVSTGTHMIFCDVLKFSTAGKERQCIRHWKDGSNFKFNRLSKVVVAMLGYDVVNDELYGLSRDDKAYLVSKDKGKTWFTIPKARWEQIKALSTTKPAVKVPWKPKSQMVNGIAPKYVVDNYGADFYGIKHRESGSWSMVVDWSSY